MPKCDDCQAMLQVRYVTTCDDCVVLKARCPICHREYEAEVPDSAFHSVGEAVP